MDMRNKSPDSEKDSMLPVRLPPKHKVKVKSKLLFFRLKLLCVFTSELTSPFSRVCEGRAVNWRLTIWQTEEAPALLRSRSVPGSPVSLPLPTLTSVGALCMLSAATPPLSPLPPPHHHLPIYHSPIYEPENNISSVATQMCAR